MMMKDEIIAYLKEHKDEFMRKYGIEEIALFGSFARGEAHEESDVDIFVKMKPDLFKMVALKERIGKDLHKEVDLIRDHPHIKPTLLKMIRKDLVNV